MAFTMRHQWNPALLTKPVLPSSFSSSSSTLSYKSKAGNDVQAIGTGFWALERSLRHQPQLVCSLDRNSSGENNTANGKKGSVPNSNYVVPWDKSFTSSSSSCITRPLAEILRDLNKKIPDNRIRTLPNGDLDTSTYISWYHANRMLSFYAPGWCGEIRDVIFSDNGSVTVVYRVTIRGSDGEAHRESSGTVSSVNPQIVDPVAAAEEIAFCKACARFGLGLYLYHED